MPPRLGYTKSRRGCLRCKGRKVKCDEQRPACGWCRTRALSCEYPRNAPSRPTSLPSTAITTGATIAPATPSASATSSDNVDNDESRLSTRDARSMLLDLCLLHYYVINVAPTFPLVDRSYALKLHADYVPQLAFQHSGLLSAMYAYALLHIHIRSTRMGILPHNADFLESLGLSMTARHDGSGEDPDASDTTDLLTLHRFHLNQALSKQRASVSNVTEKNADGVCMTSVLIAMISLVHASEEAAARKGKPYKVPLDWFYLFRSFTPCLHAARPHLKPESATTKLIEAIPQSLPDLIETATVIKFRHLLEWQPYPQAEAMEEDAVKAYEKAVMCVEFIYDHIVDGKPWEVLGRHILAVPNIVSDKFVTYLEEGRPRALVILAHLLIMTREIDEKWWIFHGVADTHVKGLASIISAEWQWAMSWPLRILLNPSDLASGK